MPRRARAVDDCLTGKLGFTRDDQRRHVWFERTVPGVPKVTTMMSHGEVEVRDPLLSTIARQLRITRSQFIRLIDCHMDGPAYTAEVIKWAQANRCYKLPPPPR